LDLFPAQRNKRIWDLKVNHLGRAYDVIGVFNFGETNSEQMTLRWSDLGLPSDKPLHVFDFWNKDYLGAWEAGITLDVAPTDCRVLTVLPSNGKIQLISTNRHITQGWVDLAELKYDDAAKAYSGKSHVIKNDPYELQFVFPRDRNFEVKSVTARAGAAGLPATFANHQGWATVKIRSSQTADVMWRVQFEPAAVYSYPVAEPTNLRVERAGLDGINLTWNEQYYLNAGYQVYLDGKLQGYTPKAAFQFRGLDPKAEHTAAVETVWEDGVVSKRKAETTFSIKAMAPRQMPLSQLQPIRSSGRGFQFMGARGGMSPSGPLSVAGKFYADAISVQPGIDVAYEIKGLFGALTALVGMGSESAGEESVEFVALADGKEIWRSGKVTKADGAKAAKVDVTGVQHLVLRVEGGAPPSAEFARGRGAQSRIQAAWLEAVLSKKE